MNQIYTSASGVETRTIEQSLSAVSEAMGRAEYMLERLHYAVTGYEPPPNAASPTLESGALGIMHDADRLARRLEGFCSDLERTASRVTAGNVQSLAKQSYDANYGHAIAGRAGI